MRKDVFICHASEDKTSAVRPLASSLQDRGISYWLDEAELSVGESISEQVNEGLKISDFVIVILSRAFMLKNWPKKELWSVLNKEAQSGKVIILPILIGTQNEVNSIIEEFPLLNDKLFILWNGDVNRVANAIQNSICKFRGEEKQLEQLQMHKCGHCKTPFQNGVYVCLGCQGTILYGLSKKERLNIRQTSAIVIGIILFITMVPLPIYLSHALEIEIPKMWGIGILSLPISLIIIFAGTFYIESKLAKIKSHLIRTIR